MWDVKTTLKDIAIIWNKIYLTATALLLLVVSLSYTSKTNPSILSYPFCVSMKQSHTKQSRATQDPFCNVTTEAAQPYSFHFIFQVILLHSHSSLCYKVHIYATRDTTYEPNQRTFVHSSRTRWFTTGLREFRASRKFPGSFPKRRFGVCADPPPPCEQQTFFSSSRARNLLIRW